MLPRRYFGGGYALSEAAFASIKAVVRLLASLMDNFIPRFVHLVLDFEEFYVFEGHQLILVAFGIIALARAFLVFGRKVYQLRNAVPLAKINF